MICIFVLDILKDGLFVWASNILGKLKNNIIICVLARIALVYIRLIFLLFFRERQHDNKQKWEQKKQKKRRRRTAKFSEIKNRLYLTNLLKSFDQLPPLPPPALQCPPACDLNLSPLVGQVPISQMPGTVSNLCSVTYHYQGQHLWRLLTGVAPAAPLPPSVSGKPC